MEEWWKKGVGVLGRKVTIKARGVWTGDSTQQGILVKVSVLGPVGDCCWNPLWSRSSGYCFGENSSMCELKELWLWGLFCCEIFLPTRGKEGEIKVRNKAKKGRSSLVPQGTTWMDELHEVAKSGRALVPSSPLWSDYPPLPSPTVSFYSSFTLVQSDHSWGRGHW